MHLQERQIQYNILDKDKILLYILQSIVDETYDHSEGNLFYIGVVTPDKTLVAGTSKDSIGQKNRFQGIGFGVYVGISVNNMQNTIDSSIIKAIIVGIIILAVVAVIGTIIGRKIAEPIESIERTVEIIGEGDLTTEYAIKGKNEIGRLAEK